ncbi:MAG: hypothetical protein R3C11_28765 [Planctomycetaceae bacterium]
MMRDCIGPGFREDFASGYVPECRHRRLAVLRGGSLTLGRKIIDDDGRVASLQESLGDVAAYKSGTTSDQHAHRTNSPTERETIITYN